MSVWQQRQLGYVRSWVRGLADELDQDGADELDQDFAR